MYAQYFGLRENPFTITPNPRYLYLGAQHTEALAHLIYGVTESSGFIQLTGEVGTGKTMLIRSLLEQLPDLVDVALVVNPHMTPAEFLHTICSELEVPVQTTDSNATVARKLSAHLLETHAQGRRVVLIVDEAQALPSDQLELVRLLTNLETPNYKLLQIILVGQPELRETLARRDLRQLAQRVTGRYHLNSLNAADTRAYVEHRLKIAGAGGTLFTDGAIRTLYRLSGGVPRVINILADRTLLGAYAAGKRLCNAQLVRQAGRETLPETPRSKRRLWYATATFAAIVLVLAAAAAWRWNIDPVIQPAVASSNAAVSTVKTATRQKPDNNSDPIAAWLTKTGAEASTRNAFTTLFSLWNAAYKPTAIAPACGQAQAAGLRCVYAKGGWQTLVSYNRPAILGLTASNGQPYQVVISALTKNTATLHAGTKTARVPIDALRQDWNGEFLLLWHPPHNAEGVLRKGMSGAAVQRLRQQLGALEPGLSLPQDQSIYGDALAEAVRTFQQDHGLRADGIAGEHTLIELNNVLKQSDIPRLRQGTP